MAVALATKYLPYVDEIFKAESKTALLTNKDFDFAGANSVKIYKIGTAAMNDYSRTSGTSRYGTPADLTASVETFTLAKDRSFTFIVDKLDEDETAGSLNAATALARQIREKVVPEVDGYTIEKIVAGAGTTATAAALDETNIYGAIIDGTNVLDENEIPEDGRFLLVTPATYRIMKASSEIIMETEAGAEARARGVIGNLDGMTVLRIPAARVPAKFGFAIVHPSATVGVEKLAEYQTHSNPPGISGDLVEGRIVYDAFVLENRAKGIYYQPTT